MKLKTHILLFIFCVALLPTVQSQILFTNIDSLQKVYNKPPNDTTKVITAIRIGIYYVNRDAKKAINYLMEGYNGNINNQQQAANYKILAATMLAKANANLGNRKDEHKWTDISKQFFLTATDPYALDYAYEQAAIEHINASKFDSGIYYAQQAIHMWDSLKIPTKTIRGYFTIANTYYMMRYNIKAIENLYKLIKYSNIKITDNNPILLNVFRLFADVYDNMNKSDSVMYFSKKGIAIAQALHNTEAEIDFLVIQSNIYENTKQFNTAITIAKKAYNLSKEINYEFVYANLFQTLALSYASLQQKDSSYVYGNLAEHYRKVNLQSSFEYTDIYNVWAAIYQRLGNYNKAFLYKDSQYIAYKNYNDSTVEASAIEKEIQFETAKKEAQINTLAIEKKQAQTRQWFFIVGLVLLTLTALLAYISYRNKKRAATVLEQSNKEKEVFLKEIHHRVKNNLQIISSLLYMQFKDTQDNAMLAQLKQAQERIKSMALVHNKLYEKQDVVHVYLKEYIQDLATGILSSNTPSGKQINLHIEENQQVHLSLDTSISVGLILNELITNSCKYAFGQKQAGNIHISIQENNRQYILQVKDDGSGLPENYEQKNSLGVRLVKNLTRQLQGTINFTNNNGTVVQIQFKEAIAA